MSKRVNWARVKAATTRLQADMPQHTTTAARGREPTESELSKLKLAQWHAKRARLKAIDDWLKEK